VQSSLKLALVLAAILQLFVTRCTLSLTAMVALVFAALLVLVLTAFLVRFFLVVAVVFAIVLTLALIGDIALLTLIAFENLHSAETAHGVVTSRNVLRLVVLSVEYAVADWTAKLAQKINCCKNSTRLRKSIDPVNSSVHERQRGQQQNPVSCSLTAMRTCSVSVLAAVLAIEAIHSKATCSTSA
jgi:hypothetical protein